MEENNVLVLIDENGNEKEMQILLTFEMDNGKKFVLITDPEDVSDDVYPYSYDDDGNLYEVEDPAEFAMCEEVLNTFLDEE
ncbi:MAG: DUF1292 domain-containing protein [Solobacterium sp.]|nr:DUF1292 domain-containing protein [Solobacterium sp.]